MQSHIYSRNWVRSSFYAEATKKNPPPKVKGKIYCHNENERKTLIKNNLIYNGD